MLCGTFKKIVRHLDLKVNICLLTEEALPLQENVCTLILSSNWLSLSELLDIILMLDKSTNNQEYSRLFDGAD